MGEEPEPGQVIPTPANGGKREESVTSEITPNRKIQAVAAQHAVALFCYFYMGPTLTEMGSFRQI
jgi:hypothetical protein